MADKEAPTSSKSEEEKKAKEGEKSEEKDDAQKKKEAERRGRDDDRRRYMHHKMMRMMMMADHDGSAKEREMLMRRMRKKTPKDAKAGDDVDDDEYEMMMAEHMDYFMSSFYHRSRPREPSPSEIARNEMDAAFKEPTVERFRAALKKWEELEKPIELKDYWRRSYSGDYQRDDKFVKFIRIFVEELGFDINQIVSTGSYHSDRLDALRPAKYRGLNGGKARPSYIWPSHRASTDAIDVPGPLFWSSYNLLPTVLEEVIACGAEVKQRAPLTCTGLHAAISGVFYYHSNRIGEHLSNIMRVIDTLIAHGVEVDARDERGLTPLFVLLVFMEKERNFPTDVICMIVNHLLQHGADPRLPPVKGTLPIADLGKFRSPLHLAAEHGHVGLLSALHGYRIPIPLQLPKAHIASPDAKADLYAAIYLAVEHNHVNALEYLLLTMDDDVNTQANAMEMMGANMAVGGETYRRHDDKPKYPVYEDARKKDMSLQGAVMFFRRAARLREKHGVTVKQPPVAEAVEFEELTLFEPSTEKEYDMMGLTTAPDLHQSKRNKGAVFGVAFLVQVRLFAPRSDRQMRYLQRAGMGVAENLNKKSITDHRARLVLLRREMTLWEDKATINSYSADMLFRTCEHVQKVVRPICVYRELVDEYFPFIDWFGKFVYEMRKGSYAAGHIMDYVNRMLLDVVILWPQYFGNGRAVNNLDIYQHPVLQKYCERCNRPTCSPLHVVADRSHYIDHDRTHEMSYRSDYSLTFNEASLGLVRLWVANGSSISKRCTSGTHACDAIVERYMQYQHGLWDEERSYYMEQALAYLYLPRDKEEEERVKKKYRGRRDSESDVSD